MTPEDDGLMYKASMALLATSNLLGDAGATLGEDPDIGALSDLLVTAHLYLQERRRSLATQLPTPALGESDSLSAKRQRFAEKLLRVNLVFSSALSAQFQAV